MLAFIAIFLFIGTSVNVSNRSHSTRQFLSFWFWNLVGLTWLASSYCSALSFEGVWWLAHFALALKW
uniref:Uncharacterized protein n=1 Tax=Arundo donax TaxID=35708 RepID=A0A0A9F6M9_ARUDO